MISPFQKQYVDKLLESNLIKYFNLLIYANR